MYRVNLPLLHVFDPFGVLKFMANSRVSPASDTPNYEVTNFPENDSR